VKNKKTQVGSAHLIVVLVLVLALIGSLGFIFWQNFMQQKTNDDKAVVVTPEVSKTDDATPAVPSNDGYLVLEDWGVKYKLPSDLGNNTIKYYKVSDNPSVTDGYYFSTSRVEGLGAGCLPTDQYYGALAMTTRSTMDNNNDVSGPSAKTKIGDYYYFYWHPQAACTSGSDRSIIDIEMQDSDMIQTMLKSVEKL